MEQPSTQTDYEDHYVRANVLARRTRPTPQTGAQKEPVVASIEIVERRSRPLSEDWLNDIIVPDDVRINGQSLVTPDGYPVKVHEIVSEHKSLVVVTLTLVAKRVFIGAEYADEDPGQGADSGTEQASAGAA